MPNLLAGKGEFETNLRGMCTKHAHVLRLNPGELFTH